MRTWCAAIAVSALLALPLCARQNSDGVGAAAAENMSAKMSAGDITPAARKLFAMPEAPRPKPFPVSAKSDSITPPGQLVPRYEIAGMFDYVNFNPGGGFVRLTITADREHSPGTPSRWIGAHRRARRVELQPQRQRHGLARRQSRHFWLVRVLNFRRFDYFVPFVELMVGAGIPARR